MRSGEEIRINDEIRSSKDDNKRITLSRLKNSEYDRLMTPDIG